MITPLYKSLKNKGTTIYVFPGAAEDGSNQRQNDNYKMVFTHIALLRIPRQNLTAEKALLAFDDAFTQSPSWIAPGSFKEQLIESLRNYVANYEVTMRKSRTGPNEFFYDPTEIATPTERIFWKWLKKLNALDLEPALPTEDYPAGSADFDNLGTAGNTDHFREILWRERVVKDIPIISVAENTGQITVIFTTSTNFRPGDVVVLTGVTGLTAEYVIDAVSTTTTTNDTIEFTGSYAGALNPASATGKLVYQRLVQYIGEVTVTNNVAKPDSTYTQVYAHVSDQAGKTPVILFKTVADNNYRPGMNYPILSAQEQPEIWGAENAQSPIVSNPSSFPGTQYGHFDALYNYTTSNGDVQRRSGNYFGVFATNNLAVTNFYPDLDGTNIDGLTIDFNIDHYSKALLTDPACTNFDELASSVLAGEAPDDFEFNAVLWYYDVIDQTTAETLTAKNLYAVQFMDNPDNDIENTADFIPVLEKLVANGDQDGSAFTLSFDMSEDVDSESQPPAFDPDRIASMQNFELFEEAMTRLSLINDSYEQLIGLIANASQNINDLKSLLYTQKSLDTAFSRMDNLESLLRLYSTLQIGTSDTIVPVLDLSTNPPSVKLNSVDRTLSQILQLKTTQLYTQTAGTSNVIVTSTPKVVSFANAKDFMVILENDDPVFTGTYDTAVPVPTLRLTLEKDLTYRQRAEFLILPNDSGGMNKKLDLYVNFDDGTAIAPVALFENLNLPVTTIDSSTAEPYNGDKVLPKLVPTDIFYTKVGTSRYIVFDFDGDMTSLPAGTRALISNLRLKNPSTTDIYNVDGQYTIDEIPTYIPSSISAVQLVAAGSGYVHTSLATTFTAIVNLSPFNIAGFQSYGSTVYTGCQVGLSFVSGQLNNVQLLMPGNGFTPSTTQLFTGTTALTTTAGLTLALTSSPAVPGLSLNAAPSTAATIRLQTKARTRVRLKLTDADDFITAFNPLIASTADGILYPINDLLRSAPVLTYNIGHKVIVTRISEQINTLPAEWYKRYRVETQCL